MKKKLGLGFFSGALVLGLLQGLPAYAVEKAINLPQGQTCETWRELIGFKNNLPQEVKLTIAKKDNIYAQASELNIPAQTAAKAEKQTVSYSYTFLKKDSGSMAGFVKKNGSPFCYLSFQCKKIGKQQYQSVIVARGKECDVMTEKDSYVIHFGADNPTVPS